VSDLPRFRADVDDFRFGSVTPGGGGLGREEGDADCLLGFGDDGSDGGLSPAGIEGGLIPAGSAGGLTLPPGLPGGLLGELRGVVGFFGMEGRRVIGDGFIRPLGVSGEAGEEEGGAAAAVAPGGRGGGTSAPPAGRLLPNAALGGGGGGGAPLGLKASGGGGGGAPAPPPAGTDALCRWAFADAICCIR
jgi:hypothetical protein